MPSATVEALRVVNHNLRAGMEGLRLSQTGVGSIRAKDFAALRNEIVHAANCVPGISHNCILNGESKDAELEAQLSEYRSNLIQLAQILPLVHLGLRVQKGRLKAALDHLQAVAAWADASSKSW